MKCCSLEDNGFSDADNNNVCWYDDNFFNSYDDLTRDTQRKVTYAKNLRTIA